MPWKGLLSFTVHPDDIKGKELLKTQGTFYVGDPAIISAVLGYRDRMIAGVLENIVLLELKRKGYEVYVGNLRDKEIDFIAETPSSGIYVQVAYKLKQDSTIALAYEPCLPLTD